MRTTLNIKRLAFVALVLASCNGSDYTPKPKGYPRIVFPEKTYREFQGDCPFVFSYPELARISPADEGKHPCWLNLDYPYLKARIHLSYKPVENNLGEYLEDSRTLVYKHTIKADAINEVNYIDSVNRVYAKVYQLAGNAASSVQFYATDSLHHFLRGALYFSAKTNSDSLEPAIQFISEDIEELIGSLRWTAPSR